MFPRLFDMRMRLHLTRWVRRLIGLVIAYPRPIAATAVMLCVMGTATVFYAHVPPVAPVQPAPIITPRTELSDQEKMLAETIFRAQKRGDFDYADELMAQLDNQILLGHMLASRYLDAKYDATPAELTVWLENYGDHPEAARIKALAQRKGASGEALDRIATIDSAPLKGDGYIDHLGRRSMPDAFYRGLARWREKAYGAALKEFAATTEATKLGDWQQAAANYWAYRAAIRVKQDKDAYTYLTKASSFPVTFYGQLANQQLGNHAALMAAMPSVPARIAMSPAVLRARALAAANQRDLAEDELRQLVLVVDKDDRPAVLAVAGQLGLANLQVRLASLNNLSPAEKLFAQYPMPPWFMSVQSKIDPALMLSMARQESVFRDDIRSTMGATGMMQMLPSTARHVEASLSPETIALASTDDSIPLSKQLSDPAVNIHLGAQYVAILARQPMVKNDLIRLIAAYNAGPGSVAGWQRMAKIDDPLLYVESIPYPETRNYVMQVMAHQWVYQTLLGETPHSLVALATGQWPQLNS